MSQEPTLKESLNEAEWSWIKPHALRDAVVIVDKKLEVLDVGNHVASNNLGQIQKWVDQGLITKPSLAQIQSWDENPGQRFLSLIVQPFVLIQEIDLKH